MCERDVKTLTFHLSKSDFCASEQPLSCFYDGIGIVQGRNCSGVAPQKNCNYGVIEVQLRRCSK